MSRAKLGYDCYFLNVPWSADYKHCYYPKNIDTEEAQFNDIIQHSSKHYDNLNVIVKNNAFIIKGALDDFTSYNYIVYKNSEQEHWTYAFITDVIYNSYRGTTIYHQIDVFQTYIHRCTFKKCILERGHITKAEDTAHWYKYTAPEPIGFPAIIEADRSSLSSISFEPVLVMDSASFAGQKYNEDDPSSPMGEYKYGGNGDTNDTMTGYYRYSFGDKQDRETTMELWTLGEYQQTTISHIGDIIGFSYLPKWVINDKNWETIITPTTKILNSNAIEDTGIKSIDTSPMSNNDGLHLSCNYYPRNKKMFTSLARALKIWNKNGLSIPLKPEQLETPTGNTRIQLYMRPMSSTFKLEILNYKDLDTRYIDIPYSYSIALGINANVGTAKQTAINDLKNQVGVLKAGQKQAGVNAVAQLASTITGGLINVGNTEIGNNYRINNAMAHNTGTPTGQALVGGAQQTGAASFALAGIGTALNIATTGYTMSAGLDTQLAQMTVDDFRMQTAVYDAYSSITGSIGFNSDRTNMSDDFCRIRIAEISPTYEECAIIDDFLDEYGYTINEIVNPKSYFDTRSVWNYIKTVNNASHIIGCSNDNKVFKEIFNAGTTLWHSWNNFGNYTVSNN